MGLLPRIPVSTSHHKKGTTLTGPVKAHTQNRALILVRPLAPLTPIHLHSLYSPLNGIPSSRLPAKGDSCRDPQCSHRNQTDLGQLHHILFRLIFGASTNISPDDDCKCSPSWSFPVGTRREEARVPARCCYYCRTTADFIHHIIPMKRRKHL